MRKRKSKLPVKLVLMSLLCLLGLSLLLLFSAHYLTTSDYFEIKIPGYFAGQNIFKINLCKEEQRLRHMNPDYKNITLRRLLPDRIIIDFELREPVALLRLSSDFYVDGEGVLFRPSSVGFDFVAKRDSRLPSQFGKNQANQGEGLYRVEGVDHFQQLEDSSLLPLIIGLDARIPHPQLGVKCNEPSLQAILEFLNNLYKDKSLTEQLKINEINLTNVNDIFLFTTSGCKINLGGIGSLKKDLLTLQRLIGEMKLDLTVIEYIDLRFREPVMKYK